MAGRKHKTIKRRRSTSTVAIEILHSEAAVVIVDRPPGSPCQVRGFRTRWLREAPGLHHELGVAELSAALETIVTDHHLAGSTVHVALSSEFCVTRVVAGETSDMLSELRNLRDRSDHYLSLGAGPKAISQTIGALDVRHSQAWLTVTNRKTLDHVIRALEDIGLFPAMIEHSMVAVCRAVGRMQGDVAAPAIIIEPNDRDVDLGVSYRGQLLLDYRPGGVGSKETIVNTIEQHLERIQRYCSRFFRFASGQLNRVYLVGSPDDVAQVRQQFAGSRRLTAEVFDPTAICSEWQFSESLIDNPFYAAALGSALVSADDLKLAPDERGFPDLLDTVRKERKPPIWPIVRRQCWPVAAAVLLGLAIYGGALAEHSRAAAVEAKIASIQADAESATKLHRQVEQLTQHHDYLGRIQNNLTVLPVHELLAGISRAKPKDVFLDDIKVNQERQITLSGKAEMREAVFSFETNLKRLGFLRSPRIESTRPDRLPGNEHATGFLLKANFADQADR